MCNPIAISLALTAAGTAANAAAANKAQKAMQGAREAERVRQKGHQDASNAVMEGNMASADKGSQDAVESKALADRQAASDAAVASVRAPVEATGANLAGDQTANTVIDSEKSAQASKALGYAAQQGGAKAKLMSFNDLNFNNALVNARAQQDQARIANFAKGSADVLPIELEAASHKGEGLKTLGSLLSTAGMVTGMGAGAGWFGSPAAAAAPTIGNTVTASSLLPTTNGISTFGVNPNMWSMGNPNNLFLNAINKVPIR